MEKKFKKYKISKLALKENFNNISKNIKNKTYYQEIKNIKTDIIEDISECNAKQAKDIILLIDFNIYSNSQNNDKINFFINQTKTIFDNYLSPNDRLSVFIYKKQYHIINPFLHINQIDIKSFTKDLINYKSKIFKEKEDEDEYDINIDILDDKNFSENSLDDEESEEDNKDEIILNNIEGLVKTINYCGNYLEMKEEIKNEKYIILFTDLFNYNLFWNENKKNI